MYNKDRLIWVRAGRGASRSTLKMLLGLVLSHTFWHGLNAMPIRSSPICFVLLVAWLAGCQPVSKPTNQDGEAVSVEETIPMQPQLLPSLESTESKLLFEIRSERGIGSGILSMPGPTWPKEVVLHIYLRGLESLKVQANGLVWELNVSSSLGYAVTDHYANTDRDATSEPPRIYVMPNKQSISLIPLVEGQFFEVVLPSKLFDSNPPAIEVSWIDFYR